MNNQNLSFEDLRSTCKKVDEKFESLIKERAPREQAWRRVHNAATKGKLLEGRILELTKAFQTNLGDQTFPSHFRQNEAEKMAFLSKKWHELEPVGEYWTDLELANAVNEFLHQKFNSNQSRLRKVFRNFQLMSQICNVAVLHVGWHREAPQRYKQDVITLPDGFQQVRCIKEPNELTYQGPIFSTVNPFHFYLDSTAPRFDDLNALDKYYKEPMTLSEIKYNRRFNPEYEYMYPDKVIYRGIEGLDKLQGKSSFVLNPEEKQMDSLNSQRENQDRSSIVPLHLDVRTAILKELRINEKESLSNVQLVYIKCNDFYYPLLLEYNPQAFNQSPFIVFKELDDPFELYNPSRLELVFNSFSYANFLKAARAKAAATIAFPTKFTPKELRNATSKSPSEFAEAMQQLGRNIPYQKSGSDGYSGNGQDIFSPGQAEAIQAFPVLSQELASVEAEMDKINTSIQTGGGGQETARFVSYVANKQDKLANDYWSKLANEVLEPIVEMTLDNMKVFFTDEKVIADMSSEEWESLLGEEKQYKPEQFNNPQYQKMDNGLLAKEAQAFMASETGRMIPIPFQVLVNPVMKKKVVFLAKFLLDGFKGKAKTKIDNNDYSKPFYLELIMQLANFAATIQDPALKAKIFLNIATRYMQLTDDPQAESFISIFKEDVQRLSQPDPQQGVENDIAAANAQATAQEKAARAEHLQASAAEKVQKMQMNEQAAQMQEAAMSNMM